MKKLILALIAIALAIPALSGTVNAGEVCSRYEGTNKPVCLKPGEADPIPATTDEGLGAGGGAAQ